MKRKTIQKLTMIAASILAMNAQALEFGKPIPTMVVVTKPSKENSVGSKKQVMLMNIKLNAKEQNAIFSYQPKKSFPNSKDVPASFSLGMNDVPVLDQGQHGSCVTFATTAAVDALIGQGDYISQLCQLELGATLEKNGYFPSGWGGSMGSVVLDQMMRFGVISKADQRQRTCAGVTEYPLNDYTNEGNPMTLEEFKISSQYLDIYSVQRMSAMQRFDSRFSDTDQAERVLSEVKSTLVKGNRLVIGTLVVLSPYCSAGACASFHAKQDTWALTKELETPPFGMAGHEMVITGYDDNAVATDAAGKTHKGLITLRNSWSDAVGDAGNYYMSYDYFKKFAMEVNEVAVPQS